MHDGRERRRGARGIAALAGALAACLACSPTGAGADGGPDGASPGDDCPTGWVRVSPTTSPMGSPRTEAGHRDCEEGRGGGPITVTFDHAWCVPSTEVTQARWRAAMGTNPSQHAGCDDCPVECVNWYEAAAYCNALSDAEDLPRCHDLGDGDGTGCGGTRPGEGTACNGAGGMACDGETSAGPACAGYRLPTEAEWEAAARGGIATAFYTFDGGGFDPDPLRLQCQPDTELSGVSWYCGSSGMATHPVGGLAPNPLGLHDVLGNVAEWVQDAWHDDYDGAPSDGSAWAGPPGSGRVVRGGAWISDVADVRLAARTSDGANYRVGSVGFRCVRTVPTRP